MRYLTFVCDVREGNKARVTVPVTAPECLTDCNNSLETLVTLRDIAYMTIAGAIFSDKLLLTPSVGEEEEAMRTGRLL